MKRYETIFILDPDLEEEPAQTALEKIRGIITQFKGEILKDEDWGKRKLAYDVKKKSRGHYRLIEFSGSPPLLSELERNFRVMDAVIKFQTILLDERKVSTSKVIPPEEPLEEETAPKET
jgi:small subunit ribosomal protein S6